MWMEEMKSRLSETADALESREAAWQGSEEVFRPEDWGYTAGEKATAAIQRAIDAAG